MNEPVWIYEELALRAHDSAIVRYGGVHGLRSEDLFRSAIARPKQIYAYSLSPDSITLAAAYTVGLVRNHPFLDGNKRTGFIVGTLFLRLNGLRLVSTQETVIQTVTALAARALDENGYVTFLRACTRDKSN